mgnify:CR=1 FL=1
MIPQETVIGMLIVSGALFVVGVLCGLINGWADVDFVPSSISCKDLMPAAIAIFVMLITFSIPAWTGVAVGQKIHAEFIAKPEEPTG